MTLNEKTMRERNRQIIEDRYKELINKEKEGERKEKGLVRSLVFLCLVFSFGLIVYLCRTVPAQEELSAHNAKVFSAGEAPYFGRHLETESKYKEQYDPNIYMRK